MAEASSKPKPAKTLNINVGVLGHVDSGKTSLSRALSTVGSTAAFDKHPQSKERGITLDLGFSSFLRVGWSETSALAARLAVPVAAMRCRTACEPNVPCPRRTQV